MADTGQNLRYSRTNVAAGAIGSQKPSERSQLVAQEVPQFHSKSEGLGGLSTAFDNFFGRVSGAIGSVEEGVMVGQEARIQQENAAQKQQALGDALEGKPMDPTKANDMDYVDAYRAVRAKRDGYDASQEFNQYYLTQWLPNNPTGDLSAARDDWAKKNLSGATDPSYQGQLLSSFYDATDGMIPQHQEFALKYQTQKGMETLGSALDADVASGTMDAAKLSDYIAKARVLDPLNSNDAPSRVASSLLASAENHPEQMMAVANLLDQPGTGVNGKSFAQTWPQAYAGFQDKAVSAWNTVNSLGDLKTYTDFEDRLRNAKTADDLSGLTVDVIDWSQRRGAVSQRDSILNSIAEKMKGFAAIDAGKKSIDGFMSGDFASAKPEDVRKFFPDWMKDRLQTGDIMQADPALASETIAQLAKGSIVPDVLQTQLSAGLMDSAHPDRQAHAVQLMSAVQNTVGLEAAKKFLSEPAARLYDQVAQVQAIGSEDTNTIVQRMNETKQGVKDWSVGWDKLTGDTSQKAAEKRVQDILSDEFTKALGDPGVPVVGNLLGHGARPVTIPSSVLKAVMDDAKQRAIIAQGTGQGFEAGVRGAAQHMTLNAEAIPGANGQLTLTFNASQDTHYTDASGRDAVRPRMALDVVNPETGAHVNTVQVYYDQRDQLDHGQGRWALPSGTSAAEISLGAPDNPLYVSHGLIPVNDLTDTPVVWAAGTKVHVPAHASTNPPTNWLGFEAGKTVFDKDQAPADSIETSEVTIPSDDAGMQRLRATLPQGFDFVRHDTSHGVVWLLGYRPNYGSSPGVTLDQKITESDLHNQASGGMGW